MENTDCQSNCAFVKNGLCKHSSECPNYMTSIWINEKGNQQIVSDCIPKRLLIQQNLHHNRLEGLQQALEQQRNVFIQVAQNFDCLISELKKIAENQNLISGNQIEKKED